MKLAKPENIIKAIRNDGSGTGSVTFGDIDFSRYFMPEELTQLFHTPAYELLSDAQRLRYNQLFALRTSEQLMTLEEFFIERVLQYSRSRHADEFDKGMVESMKTMAWEEQTHYTMFARLNRQAEPELYAGNDYLFATMTLPERLLLRILPAVPGLLPFQLWLLMLLEEFSTAISKKMIRHATSELEANFVKAHKAHLVDETRHVHICGNTLAILLNRTSPRVRRINVRLLHTFMNDYLTPKRGGIRVIRHLVREFPELSEIERRLIQEIRIQKRDKIIWDMIREPSEMPITHLLLDRFPDFRMADLPETGA